MTVTNTCKARDRSKCRYHGEVDHARMAVEEAQEAYNNAIKLYDNADPNIRDKKSRWGTSSSYKNRIANTKTKLNKKQAELDVIPGEFKKLKKQVDEANQNPDLSLKEIDELRNRLSRAEKFKKAQADKVRAEKAAEREAAKKQKEQNEAFENLKALKKKEESTTEDSTNWRVGYKTAVSGVIVEQGDIVNGPGSSSYGAYFPDTDTEKTVHLRQCGAFDVRNIEEDSWEEWNFNSMSSVQTSRTEYKVTADATCNCGRLVSEKIQMSGTFAEILGKVLKF